MTTPRILLCNPTVTAQPVSPWGMERIGQTLTHLHEALPVGDPRRQEASRALASIPAGSS